MSVADQPYDAGAVATPGPQSPRRLRIPRSFPDSYAGPATDGDAVRFLEQATWGPTSADIAHVKAVGFQAYLNEQFSASRLQTLLRARTIPDLAFPPDDQGTACPSTSPDPNTISPVL